MIKKHFEAFAREIRESDRTPEEKTAAAIIIMRVARQFNPRFDADRFFKAAGVDIR